MCLLFGNPCTPFHHIHPFENPFSADVPIQRFDMLPYVRLYSVLYASTICSMAVVYCFFKTHFALMRVQTWVKILAFMPGLHLIMCAVIGWGSLSTAYGILAATGFLYGSRPFLIGYMAVQVSNLLTTHKFKPVNDLLTVMY